MRCLIDALQQQSLTAPPIRGSYKTCLTSWPHACNRRVVLSERINFFQSFAHLAIDSLIVADRSRLTLTSAHLSITYQLQQRLSVPMTAEVSHGRGGAGNLAVDDTKYVDGEVVRTGVEGSHGDGAYSSGRGGAFYQ